MTTYPATSPADGPALDTLSAADRKFVADHIAAVSAKGRRPRWCVAHGFSSVWTGDDPCAYCNMAPEPAPFVDRYSTEAREAALCFDHGITRDFADRWGYRAPAGAL